MDKFISNSTHCDQILSDIEKIRYLQRIKAHYTVDSLEALVFNHADCRFYNVSIKPMMEGAAHDSNKGNS